MREGTHLVNDESISKAAQFLLTMRGQDSGHASAMCEIRAHIEVSNAIKLAGLADPTGTLVQCTECGWAGPADQLLPPEQRCPNCRGREFGEMT